MRRAAFTATFAFGFIGFLLSFLGAGSHTGTTLRWGALIPAMLLGMTAFAGYFARGFPDVGGRLLTIVLALCATAAGAGLVALFVSPAVDGGLATVGSAGLTACIVAAATAWVAFALAGWQSRWRGRQLASRTTSPTGGG